MTTLIPKAPPLIWLEVGAILETTKTFCREEEKNGTFPLDLPIPKLILIGQKFSHLVFDWMDSLYQEGSVRNYFKDNLFENLIL